MDSRAKLIISLLVAVGIGFYLGGGQLSIPEAGGDRVEACRTLCESLPVSPEMSYGTVKKVDGSPHCFCQQEQTVYDFQEGRTITWTQSFDMGIVSDTRIEESIPEEVRQQRQEQIRQQQQQLQQIGG